MECILNQDLDLKDILMSLFKRFSPFVVAIVLILIGAISISYNPTPTLATDNVTVLDSSALTSMSISIDGINSTYSDIEGDLQTVITIATFAFLAFVMFAMVAITLWRREFFIYVVGSLVVFFIALAWLKDYTEISLPFIALSLYFLSEAVLNLFGQSWETSILRLFKRKQ